ncbi:MAG: hypothetical protein FWF44_08545 [Defluviitaleaceae bacterium]|nr:hypothetical protein [Defluviitaleaceae bacterium]
MSNQIKASNRHHTHLCQFLNTKDDDLPSLLTIVEDINAVNGFSDDGNTESPFGSFHPETVRMVVRNDENYLRYRANHFVLIFGQSEAFRDEYGWDDCVVCLANHKGGLSIAVFRFNDVEEEGRQKT